MVKVRDIEIGSGIPKICASIIESTQDNILEMAEELNIHEVDIVEWRIDFCEDIDDIDKMIQTSSLLRSVLNRKPILVTFRTNAEGGNLPIDFERYSEILIGIAKSGNVDMIDVEMFACDRNISDNVEENDIISLVGSLKKSVVIVGSYHDFDATPGTDEIMDRLNTIIERGADIAKIAVMPKSRRDVLRLMEATELVSERAGETPVIAMSMGGMGLVSRIAGESFGSSVTFGCMGKASAPGQIDVRELKHILVINHSQYVNERN